MLYKFQFSGVDGLRTYIKPPFGVLVNHSGAPPLSNTSVKVAFAFFVVLASPAASFAQHAGAAATGNVPITARGVGKCFQGNPATTVTPSRPEIVRSPSVCWAPRNTTDGPEV